MTSRARDWAWVWSEFESFLAVRGMTFTGERQSIVWAILLHRKLFTAEEAVQWFAAQPGEPRLSRSTIYRTLSFLVELEILQATGETQVD